MTELKLRIGSRKSELALKQTYIIEDLLKKAYPGLETEIVTSDTLGDKNLISPLQAFGGKRRICIRAGRCPFKRRDRPGCTQCQGYACLLRRRLCIAAVSERASPGDVLVTADTDFSSFVCPRFIVGTSSPRRQCFLEECWKEVWPVNANIPEPVFQTLRGNVHTRLNKLKEGLYDGIVLAQAGLARLGICEGEEFHFYPLDPKHFIPAGGQGILAVEAKTGSPAAKLASVIDCPDAHICLDAERGYLHT